MIENLQYQRANKHYLVRMDRLYNPCGLWVQSHGCRLRVGLTDWAANQIDGVISVNLPAVASNVHPGDKSVMVTLPSIRIVFLCPLAGRVREVNTILDVKPELLVQDPFGDGWLFEVDPFDWESDKGALLSPLDFYELQIEHKDLAQPPPLLSIN